MLPRRRRFFLVLLMLFERFCDENSDFPCAFEIKYLKFRRSAATFCFYVRRFFFGPNTNFVLYFQNQFVLIDTNFVFKKTYGPYTITL